jgi:uracil-DNA glycosylase
MDSYIEKSWKIKLTEEFTKPYFKDLVKFVKSEYNSSTIYPSKENIFNAFELCPIDKVKVVILGQDPYHNPGQAMGLSFSVSQDVRIPPSLRNIYKEIQSDLQIEPKVSGDLTRWAKQGVMLLNATLTVRKNEANSHKGKGWENFTDAVIKTLNEESKNVVFLLWGNYAKKKGEIIDREKHYVLEAAHPSPFAAYRGFFDCKHFSKCNKYLALKGKEPIDWN